MATALDLARSAGNLERVLSICRKRGRILVLMQNNPDPDAVASAAALRDLVHARLRKRVTIGYAGVCGRAENRAMLHVLHVDARQLTPDALDRYTTLCLVDTHPRSGNNALYTSRRADVVIDHHEPVRGRRWAARFADIRPHYGATSTILYEYVLAAGMKPSADLATALFYGIQSDTQFLDRDAGPADAAAYEALFPLANRKKLARIRRAPLPPDYFRMLHDGLESCVLVGRLVLCALQDCDTPDMIAEVADVMLRLDAVRTSVCYGRYRDRIHFSVRTVDARGNAAGRARRIVKGIGTAGGHGTIAAGQVPAGEDANPRMAELRRRILAVFAPRESAQPLIELDGPVLNVPRSEGEVS